MRVFIILFASFTIFSFTEPPAGCLQLDIMIIADMSSSVQTKESFMRDAVNAFTNRFELSDQGIRISVMRFADSTTLLTGFTSNKIVLRNAALMLSKADGNTQMSIALHNASSEIFSAGRPDVAKIIILITDGEPDRYDVESTKRIAEMMKELNRITICGIFVHIGAPNGFTFLKSISSESCFAEAEYESLVKTLEEMDICL